MLLRDTNRLAEAEPLCRPALRILGESGLATARGTSIHTSAHSSITNYAILLSAMGLSQDAIAVRVRSAIEGKPEELA